MSDWETPRSFVAAGGFFLLRLSPFSWLCFSLPERTDILREREWKGKTNMIMNIKIIDKRKKSGIMRIESGKRDHKRDHKRGITDDRLYYFNRNCRGSGCDCQEKGIRYQNRKERLRLFRLCRVFRLWGPGQQRERERVRTKRSGLPDLSFYENF